MEGFGLILSIILGGVAGWIAEKIMKSDHGLLMNVILGILGALVGNWLARALFGATQGGAIGQVVIAAIGACILIWLGRMVRGRG